MDLNELLLRRKNKVVVNKNEEHPEHNVRYVVTMMKNVEALGYTFSKELYDVLLTNSHEELSKFYTKTVPLLKKMVGADVVYKPMYPNFPDSVMKADEADLYINAIIHYWTDGKFYPNEAKDERLPLLDVTKVKIIDLGTFDDIQEVFTNLCQSKTSLSQTDKDDLIWIYKNFDVDLPEEIPLRETAALIGKVYIERDPTANAAKIQKYFKTATDVLRLITAMSNGDVSLASNTKYRSFRRKERRLFMELLQGCGEIEEDMRRYKNKWLRIGERIHPGEYDERQFGKVIQAFDKLRNGGKIETFSSKVEDAIRRKDVNAALELLKKRPGELARRLDHILRVTDDKNLAVNTFKSVASDVSTPVLLQVREHFAHRNDPSNLEDGSKPRVFFPKGNLARSYCIEDTLPEIDEKYCRAIVKICENALIEAYKSKEFLGNAYLSEDFKRFTVPFSQRSASKALKTVSRGSRFPIPENVKALRGFIWWTNLPDISDEDTIVHNRVDLDLSVGIFDEQWLCKKRVSYGNLRSNTYQTYHSGDIVNGGDVDGDGVSEFLDVDIDSVVEDGARYVVFQVYSYTGQYFSNLPHAMFGWMNREEVDSGEIYEPKTVEQKMDLASSNTVCVPVIFDCVNREVIWCDMGISLAGCHDDRGGNNIESNIRGVTATLYSMVNMSKPNLYDLINLHIKARGIRVDNKDDADVIFDLDSGITPYDTDVFMGEYI